MIQDRYYVKIIPQRGDIVHRFQIRKRHVAAVLGAVLLVVLGSLGFAGIQVARAHHQVVQLREQAEQQSQALTQIDKQTQTLRRQLQHVQAQNQEIRQAIGIPGHTAPIQRTSRVRSGPTLDRVAEDVRALSLESAATLRESDVVKGLAERVLNMQHLESMARAEMIAAIPSINPVPGAEIVGCYCYRTYPDVGFHKGVDLGADYGQTVHAAAAGTIVANDWDGNYGIKIDIDHGNGYHSWYAHLSRVDVTIGEHVYKGQPIAAVGATGFATGPHLHYQLMYRGEPVDPTPYLNGVPPNVLASLP